MEMDRRSALANMMMAAVSRLLPGDPRGNLEPRLLKVNVVVPGLSRSLDGLRIGQVSDTHIGATLTLDHLQRAVAVFGRDPPDIFVMTGDLLDDVNLARACLDVLGTVKAPYGHFYIMGNHENYAGRDAMLREARAHPKVKLLLDSDTGVAVPGARIHVCGLDFSPLERVRVRWEATPLPHPVWLQPPAMADDARRAVERSVTADFRLALVHHPDFFDALAAQGMDLTLSGHTHGGQVAPFGTSMARGIFKYPLGHYTQNNRHLYVNGGTGHWLPLRVGVPAEVTELTLRRV